jgi:hypothetical protein
MAKAAFRSREVNDAGYHKSGFSERKMPLSSKRNGARRFIPF